MLKLVKRQSKTAGLVPGTLIHIGDKRTGKVKITIIDYDEENFQEREAKNVEECFPFKDKSTVTWINIDGIHDVDVVSKIGKGFGMHPILLEDIVNTSQRPKLDDFDSCLFIVVKMIILEEKTQEMKVEQVSLVLGNNFVVSFQETEGDVFGIIRERLRNAKGRIRKLGGDYLVYSLLDAIVDNYFLIMEKLGDKIEAIEEELVINPTSKVLRTIHSLKRDMIFLRKSVWPLREVVSGLQRKEPRLIHEATEIYLRDVYDHTIQVIDTIETFRDMVSGMLDIYLSSLSNRMNEIMKVLTIIATIFIPITFIVGIYGMNFKYMPELQWRCGYLFVWGLILLIVAVMAGYFKRKKWL